MSEAYPALAGIPTLAHDALPPEPWADHVLTQIGVSIDATVVRAAGLAIDAFLMPRPEELPAMLATAAPFLSNEMRADPRRYLALASAPKEILSHTHRRRRSLRGGTVYSRRLAIDFQPNPGTEPDGRSGKHDLIHLEHWTQDGSHWRPTVLALHGFGMGNPRIDAFTVFASELFHHGCDVALMTLPYHAARRPPGARISGQHFTSVDVGQLNDAVRRAVHEIIAVEIWLRRQHDGAVGLVGLSLGGYIASLMAALVDRLDFVIPIVPPVCIGDLAWRFFARSRHYRSNPGAETLYDDLRWAYRVHSPLTYPAVVPKERLLILAARGDQIVPPEHPHALWRHWGEPDIDWFSGSHLAPFHRGRLAKRITDHIERCVY